MFSLRNEYKNIVIYFYSKCNFSRFPACIFCILLLEVMSFDRVLAFEKLCSNLPFKISMLFSHRKSAEICIGGLNFISNINSRNLKVNLLPMWNKEETQTFQKHTHCAYYSYTESILCENSIILWFIYNNIIIYNLFI